MRKTYMTILVMLLSWMLLQAIPQALHYIPSSFSKEAPAQTDVFHIQGSNVYCVDNLRGVIKNWDITKKAFAGEPLVKLPLKTIVNDITGDENFLYVLDSKNSAIYVYTYAGKLVSTISGKGSADIQFKKAIRILVNYQGYLFVLDSGREELMAFTNEGMFMGREKLLKPLSMCLGEDQIIRVLVDVQTHQEVVSFDQDLKQGKSFEITTPQNKSDFVADIAINQYNELYAIYAKSTKIGKTDATGHLLPKSAWGSKDKGESMQVFLQPAIIKVTSLQNNAMLGILDSKTKVVKLYQDSDFNNLVKLEKPQMTLRPFLEEKNEPLCLDNLVSDSLAYYLYDATVQSDKAKNIITRAIACKGSGKTLFTIYAMKYAANGCKSFDAFAIYQNKLFVVDSKASKVFVFNGSNGEYLESFGSKGSKDGRLNTPKSIAIAPDGRVYIADWGNSRIAVFNDNTAFSENVELADRKLKPQLVRLSGGFLYFLANGNSIYEMPLTDYTTINPMAQVKKISTFDILYEGRLGFIDGESQQLYILYKNSSEHKYFSKQAKSQFPGFGKITHIRYNPADKSLYISDANAKSARKLSFYYSPKKPQTIRLTLNSAKQAELSWDAAEGINKWTVTEITDTGSYIHNVTEPKLTIKNPQQSIARYSVCSISADGKAGLSSEEIEDAYSYARYQSANNNFSQAILALKRAAKVINDTRLDDEIVNNYIQESQFYVRTQEYEKAMKSVEAATGIAGNQISFIMATVDIYKLMKQYQQAITYLDKFKADDNQMMQRQLISLHYLNKNYSRVQALAQVYLTRFGKDAEVIRYLAYANENTGEYEAALSGMQELIVIEDNVANNLKIGELLIRTSQYEVAINHLNRMLTRFKNERNDEINKLLGDAYYAQGNLGYAADYYNNAIKINPGNAEYFHSLGQTYYDDRKSAEAQQNFSRAYELNPTNVEYGFSLAKSLEKTFRFPDALAVLDNINKYVTNDSTSTAYHEFYADLLTRERRYDDAYRELTIAVQYNPTSTALAAKLKTAIDNREYYNQTRPEVDIVTYGYNKLFPSLQDYYTTHGIGFVKLFNTRNVAIQDVKLTISIPQITDNTIQITIPSLLPSMEHTEEIITPINNNIFTICKNGPATIATELNLEYSFDNKPKLYTAVSTTIPALGVTAMSWKNRRSFGSFVNPGDVNLRNFVNTQIVQLFTNSPAQQLNKNIQRAIQIWSYYHANGVRYGADPTSSNVSDSEIDYVQYPFQTLNAKAGDCEDLLALLASSLSVIGVDCGFIDIPGHVMLVIDSKMKPDEVMESGIELNQFIYRNDKYWIPVETTLLGKESFSVSWLEAIKRYNSFIDKGYFPDLIEFADAHKLYPPARYSEPIQTRIFDGATEAVALFAKDAGNILLMGQMAREEEFILAIKKYPSNLNVANQYAVWCVNNERTDKAANIWEQILKQDPANFASLMNLGNLRIGKGQFDLARGNFTEALKLNRDTDNVLRNLCILEYRAGSIAKAREYYKQIQDKNVLKNLDAETLADLISPGE